VNTVKLRFIIGLSQSRKISPNQQFGHLCMVRVLHGDCSSLESPVSGQVFYLDGVVVAHDKITFATAHRLKDSQGLPAI
jgi:hypothetical protein